MRAIIIVLTFFTGIVFASGPEIQFFNESMSKKVKVSGSYFKGISYKDTVIRRELFLQSSQALSGIYCVTINSIDGVYHAQLIYKLENEPSKNGFVSLPFPTSHFESLKKFKPDQIAVRAVSSTDSNCSDGMSVEFITSWSTKSKDENIYIYLRSNARSDVVYIPSVDDYIYKVKCKKLKGVYSVSYDRVCQIPLSKMRSTLEIKRKKLSTIPNYKLNVASYE